ncbi:sensor histidine kinase [Zoogloea sp.]|uniref:sensor histidine kinase n=1 Tax=Zoogloea sp. TaxID=49181 RepID=UPI002621C552|nr:ATP-binding protein [uncultured Zoogloea sp.]
MNTSDFDREWRLGELFDARSLERIAPPLAELLGADLAILDRDGAPLWGRPAAEARREALVLEIEPAGYLASSSADPARLRSAGRMFTALLRAEARYRMASALHLEAVTQDFETLKLEHSRLLASEARYRKLSEELEARVAAQVADLETRQRQLYEAEKLASVGQLAAGMAHEINNPLGFVSSNLGSFKRYLDKFAALHGRLAEGEAAWQSLDLDFILEDGAELLADCSAGLARIARIVADLKSFSNEGRPPTEAADLNACLQHAVSVIGTPPAGVRLQTALAPLPQLACNPGHLKQVFASLIRNALQAIQDAGRPGTVRIESEASAAGIHIRIADDGVGMSPAQLARAFEPFYTTRSIGTGTGLGLSTARNIVLAHHGSIELASTPGAGTTATLFFPIAP